MECNDNVKDKMPPNPSETEIAKFTSEFERCAVKVSLSDWISMFEDLQKLFFRTVC